MRADPLDLVGVRTMTCESFIADHAARCQAGQCKKYDASKPDGGGLHSIEYSRRKCAKNLWRKLGQVRLGHGVSA